MDLISRKEANQTVLCSEDIYRENRVNRERVFERKQSVTEKWKRNFNRRREDRG